MNDESRSLVEGKVNRDVTRAMHFRGGSLHPQTMVEAVEVAKMMALGMQAVPKHLRDNPGLCFGVVMQAKAWEMDVFAVANKSFVVNDRLAYEAQLLHAVVEARAPLRGRLRCTYEGENGERTCTVSGTFDGEEDPHSYTTPKVKDIPIKNSPLWKWDVDQQLFYFGSRAWARKWCPDVLLGVYAPDEAQFAGEMARDVTDHERIHNPLGGDDEAAEPITSGIVTINPQDLPAGTTVMPTEAIQTTKAQSATKPPAARKNAQAKPAAPAQAKRPDDIVLGKPPRSTGADYLAHVQTWVTVAERFEEEGFLAGTYIRDRYAKEAGLRNNLGVPLTDEERSAVQAVCKAAVERIKARSNETAQPES